MPRNNRSGTDGLAERNGVMCNLYQQPDEGAPILTWTKNADLLVVTAKPKGRDLAALYAWWLTAGCASKP